MQYEKMYSSKKIEVYANGVYEFRIKLFEYDSDKQIVNPNSPDGLFDNDVDCARYWKKLNNSTNRWQNGIYIPHVPGDSVGKLIINSSNYYT